MFHGFQSEIQDNQDIGIGKLKEVINQSPSTKNNEEWNREKEVLLKQISDLKSQNNQTQLTKEINNLKQLVQQLEKEVNQLKEEVQELKKENDNSSEFLAYLTKKENELQNKQSKLEQLRGVIETNNNELKPLKPKSDNNFPVGWVVGGGILALAGLVAVLVIRKNKTKKQ